MKFTAIPRIPDKEWGNPTHKSLKPLLRDLVNSDEKLVKVDTDPGEYASSESLSEALYKSVKRNKYPLKVIRRGGKVFIRREDDVE